MVSSSSLTSSLLLEGNYAYSFAALFALCLVIILIFRLDGGLVWRDLRTVIIQLLGAVSIHWNPLLVVIQGEVHTLFRPPKICGGPENSPHGKALKGIAVLEDNHILYLIRTAVDKRSSSSVNFEY